MIFQGLFSLILDSLFCILGIASPYFSQSTWQIHTMKENVFSQEVVTLKVNFNFSKKPERQTPPRIPESCAQGMANYTVNPGDTMTKIAQKFGITLPDLVANNPHISDPNVLYPGDVLCVPGVVVPPPRVPASCPLCYNRYTVKLGDTLLKIARDLGVPDDLIIANNDQIPDPSVLFPGDILCVPQPLSLPFCATMGASIQLPLPEVAGVALAAAAPGGQHVLAITGVNLPNPSQLGDFDYYQGFLGIPGIGGFGFSMVEVPHQTGAWSGSVNLMPLLSIGNQLYVIPNNSQTGVEGKPVLQGLLGTC